MKGKLVTLFLCIATVLNLCVGLTSCKGGSNSPENILSSGDNNGNNGNASNDGQDGSSDLPPFHKHSLQAREEAAPSCNQDGNIAYFYCAECGKCFSDEFAEREISAEDIVIAANGHCFIDGKCSVCNALKPTEGLHYTLSDDGTYYECDGISTASETQIVISDYYNGKRVTAIAREAFKGCYGLTAIIIPDTVTEIGYDAFSDTEYYNNNDNWEGDVLYLGKHLIAAKESLVGSYSVKEGTLTVASRAFANCKKLTDVVLCDGMTSIGAMAFAYCNKLKTVELTKTVKTIESYAFYQCMSLLSVDYKGTMAQWNLIVKGGNWNSYSGNYTVHCTDGDIAKADG